MKAFTCLLLIAAVAGCAFGRVARTEQFLETPKAPELFAVGAPACNAANTGCILPDYDDSTAFYQCVGGCWVGVKQHCPGCLEFDFWKQRCEWPGTMAPHPPQPAACSALPGN